MVHVFVPVLNGEVCYEYDYLVEDLWGSIGVIELVIANSLELITVKSTIAERIKHLLKAE